MVVNIIAQSVYWQLSAGGDILKIHTSLCKNQWITVEKLTDLFGTLLLRLQNCIAQHYLLYCLSFTTSNQVNGEVLYNRKLQKCYNVYIRITVSNCL